MIDHRLAFGARKSPAIFNRLTQAVRRMMEKRGFKVVAYIDDFLVIAPTFNECLLAYNTLIYLLRSLGFRISWDKLVDPTQQLVFLGINIDSVNGTLTLDPKKQEEIRANLEKTLQMKRMTRAHLERLCGQLNWAANVIPWGRTQLCPLYTAFSRLKERGHKILTTNIENELHWWFMCLNQCDKPRPIWRNAATTQLATDACPKAGGAFYQSDWTYCNWSLDMPCLAAEHINIKELAAVLVATERWAHTFANHHVIVHTDNTAAAGMINKGSTRHPVALGLLKCLASAALANNFTIEAVHIPGLTNEIPDAISRLHEPGQIARFISLYRGQCTENSEQGFWLPNHMTVKSMLDLTPQIKSWLEVLYRQ